MINAVDLTLYLQMILIGLGYKVSQIGLRRGLEMRRSISQWTLMSLIPPMLLLRILHGGGSNSSGTPEIGGWTTRELIQILRGLAGVNVVGADVVEVAPVYDTQAELTGLAAAGVVETLVELMVKKPVGHLEERQ